MARVTVEDCILEVPNRFDLVTLAAQRAKQIAAGNPITIDRDNDKDPVVALREIADKTVDIQQLREERVQHFCKRHSSDTGDTAEDTTATGDEARSAEIHESFEDTKQAASLGTKPAKLPGDMSFAEENIEVED